MVDQPPRQEWRVSAWLAADGSKDAAPPHALVILNQPVCSARHLAAMWSLASIKLCADGGANRLFDSLATDEERRRFLPDMIKGDLDSLRKDVREWYEAQGVPVIQENDLYSTDFMKCMSEVERIELERGAFHDVIAFGALGGRFDQTMASINMLYRRAEQEKRGGVGRVRQIYLASNESVAFLLRPGRKHRITCNLKLEGPTCGLIPVGGVVRALSTGLMWNLDQSMSLSFGDLVSSSNWFAEGDGDERVVEIEVDAPLVWTVEVNLA
ncbi:thiamine pyrophosphokinase [Chytriomyces sp. MP71]|nr:thiamine pyrophosphokinase [Chytriomyces sp. MP71]